MNLSIHRTFLFLLVSSLGCGVVLSLKDGGVLANKDLKIVANYWDPFFWLHNCPNDTTELRDRETGCANGADTIYGGILWEFLLFIKQAKNLSFTMMESNDELWGGICYDANNCSGSIGMVNRHEADFALGLYLYILLSHVQSHIKKFSDIP